MKRIAAVALALVALAVCAAPAHAGRVTVSISGGGAVNDDAGRIACPPTCEADYPPGSVTFTAVANGGQRFAGWSGACAQYSGSRCTINGDFDATLGAVFEEAPSDPPPDSPPASSEPPPPPQLDQVRVDVAGGFGRVTSVPGGIDCVRNGLGQSTGACVGTFRVGTRVTLTADPGLGWQVGGWNRGCESTQPSCTFTLTRGYGTVELMLTPRAARPGEVGFGVQGEGTVRRRGLADATCMPVCTFALRTSETAAFFAEGIPRRSVFSHWTGHCRNHLNPRADCVLRGQYEAREATAVFRAVGRATFRIQGQGRVRGTGGIDCGTVCATVLDPGTEYRWRPTGAPGWVFDRWEGYCHNVFGRRECDATEQPGTLASTAVFRRAVRDGRVRITVSGPGQVRGFAGRTIVCRESSPCDVRLQDVDEDNRSFSLGAEADEGARLVGWEGCPKSEFYRFTSQAEHCFTDSHYNNVHEPEDRQMRAIFVDTPRARLSVTGQGRITSCPRDETCDPETSVRVPGGGNGVLLRAIPAAGWQFARWEEYCGRWDVSRPSVTECRLRDLWHDERVRAVFVRTGAINVRVTGEGMVRHVTGPYGERGSDFACVRDLACTLTNTTPNRYRRLKAIPRPGWRFERWAGYCDRLFANDECDVPGGADRRSTQAVFVRG